MNPRRRNMNAVRFRQERWQREDEAGKLRAAIPELSELCMDVEERSGEDAGPPIAHTKRFSMEHSSAHVEIPCSERKCEGGGYDVTRDVMRSLRAGLHAFEGESVCNGSIGDRPCDRTMHWTATAAYDKDQADAA